MNRFDASNPDRSEVQCAVCESPIRPGGWFARTKHGERTVAFCSPHCAEVFQAAPQSYMRRIDTLERARSPGGMLMVEPAS